MYKVAIIEKIHSDGLEFLKKKNNFDFDVIDDVSEENLIKVLPNYDACTLRVSKLDSNILKHCKKLKVISRHGVGFDNVDTNFLKESGITLLITATANARAVAEHVIYMMLTISKGFNIYDNEVRKGNFKSNSNKITTYELFKKNILIFGFGRIGKILAELCKAFEMKIKIYDPYIDKKIIENLGYKKIDDYNEEIKNSDYISLHLPLKKDTKNLINFDIMKNMKKNSIIINTSRGGIVNENDLNKALNEKLIFGAGLDVFEKEPILNDNPLIKNKRVLLSPHTATFTEECKSRMSIETVKNIVDFFSNKINKSMVVKLWFL